MNLKRWVGCAAVMLAASAAAGQTPAPVPPELSGEIAASDRADARGRRFDELTLELARGQSVYIFANSAPGSSLTPLVELYGPGRRQPLAGSADHGPEIIAPILFDIERSGLYRLRVTGDGRSLGRYVLQIRDVTGIAPAAGPGDPPRPEAMPGIVGRPRQRFIICPGHPRCPR